MSALHFLFARCSHGRGGAKILLRWPRSALAGLSNAVRWDKAKNPIFWIGESLGVRRLVPYYCLTNGICGLDYRLWWYWIPLAFDWHPILTLPHIVASAVTIGVRATRHSIGGPKMLKPLTHFRRNVRELPTVHCDGSSRANCTEHKCCDQGSRFAASQRRS